MGSFRPGAGNQHLHWYFNFTGCIVESTYFPVASGEVYIKVLISGVGSVPSENDDLLNPPFKWCQSGIFNKTVIAINRFLQESVIHIQVLNGLE